MIKDLLSPSDVDANTMIALCSALHFKGSWEYPFDAPVEDDFHLSESDAVKTQMMQKKVDSRANHINLKKILVPIRFQLLGRARSSGRRAPLL